MDQQQGTTRIIYDTLPNSGTNVGTSLDYFSQVSGKSSLLIAGQPATNITDNRFEPGEGMVVKEIAFYNMYVNVAPGTPSFLDSSIFGLSLLNFYIGNNRVLKDLPLLVGQTTTAFNNINTVSSATGNSNNRRFLVVRLSTNIVIPPQVQFYANLRLPYAGADIDSGGCGPLRMYVKGYGKLFNPRNNY
ncbi:MAG: hypothetical protein EBS18_02415 [Actinobacteria bacterium]|nr:hypothetical protein [Actinomycetota bacterium]